MRHRWLRLWRSGSVARTHDEGALRTTYTREIRQTLDPIRRPPPGGLGVLAKHPKLRGRWVYLGRAVSFVAFVERAFAATTSPLTLSPKSTVGPVQHQGRAPLRIALCFPHVGQVGARRRTPVTWISAGPGGKVSFVR